MGRHFEGATADEILSAPTLQREFFRRVQIRKIFFFRIKAKFAYKRGAA